jgi:hypothetical protein
MTGNVTRLIVSALLTMAAAGGAAPARTPVLLELFTSEGCSDCPPADRLLEALDRTQPIAGAELIVLSEHVDYWNRLGWVDRFSAPQFSARQTDYCQRLHAGGPYTPQLVVDGRAQLVGSNGAQAKAAIEAAAREPRIAMTISAATRDGRRVTAHVAVAAGQGLKSRSADLYLAVADARAESQVKRGENAGRELAHVAVVRALARIGSLKTAEGFSKDVSVTAPADAGANGLRVVVFLQEPNGGKVLGAAQAKL